jgi:hypothetical protein
MTGRVHCPQCGTGPVVQGADQLAATHNNLLHRGQPVASARRA